MTNPPMYNVASAVLYRTLAIVRSLPLPGCVNCSTYQLQILQVHRSYDVEGTGQHHI